MSATKWTKKWAKSASIDEMRSRAEMLGASAYAERNGMVRASLVAQQLILVDEINRRLKAEVSHAKSL